MASEMNLKSKFKVFVFIVVCAVGVVCTFYSAIDFMNFVSSPKFYPLKPTSDKNVWSWSLLVNMSLIALFILQHSVLALPKIKQAICSAGFQSIERSTYLIITAFVLQVLVKNWQEIPEVTLWKFVFSRSLWWFFIILHGISWILIYVGNICMDVNELLGIKQVYYSIRGFPEPTHFKSAELRRLNSHVRHPSFLAFIVIFWIIPVMSLDRFLLSVILSIYMYLAWNTDHRDYVYQRIQYSTKSTTAPYEGEERWRVLNN